MVVVKGQSCLSTCTLDVQRNADLAFPLDSVLLAICSSNCEAGASPASSGEMGRSLVLSALLQPPLPPYRLESKRVDVGATVPTMSDILESSRAQKLNLQLQTLGPFFRITARSSESDRELGRAEGLIRVWFGGRILHLDSIRLKRETLGMEKSIFGIGVFLGAVAIRHGYDSGCRKAELLAINDSDLYHSKLVKFYTRIGFKAVYEVTGSSIGDLAHQLVWGGVGTRMDASIEELLVKWCSRFTPKPDLL
uniref:Uncharacterized protein n=1 Tax=Kalanchoe fedtschenkoi TaxID=63787 RepID=A0A7N1A5S5_KALFE